MVQFVFSVITCIEILIIVCVNKTDFDFLYICVLIFLFFDVAEFTKEKVND